MANTGTKSAPPSRKTANKCQNQNQNAICNMQYATCGMRYAMTLIIRPVGSANPQPCAIIPIRQWWWCRRLWLTSQTTSVWPLDSVLNYKLMHFQINKHELWRKHKEGKIYDRWDDRWRRSHHGCAIRWGFLMPNNSIIGLFLVHFLQL